MIFLDTDDHYLVTDTRHEMVTALLAHLDPDTVDLAALAAACLGCREEDVVITSVGLGLDEI